jgi:hypothetical protein
MGLEVMIAKGGIPRTSLTTRDVSFCIELRHLNTMITDKRRVESTAAGGCRTSLFVREPDLGLGESSDFVKNEGFLL